MCWHGFGNLRGVLFGHLGMFVLFCLCYVCRGVLVNFCGGFGNRILRIILVRCV